MEKLAKFFYGWLLNGTEGYSTDFTEDGGWKLCFVLMLLFAIIAAAIYYFVIATKVKSATTSNYLWTWIFGYIALFFFTPLVFDKWILNEGGESIWEFENNGWVVFLYIGLVNIVYYTIVFELASNLFCKSAQTKANNITLLTIFKK